jgi:hypothetical protein
LEDLDDHIVVPVGKKKTSKASGLKGYVEHDTEIDFCCQKLISWYIAATLLPKRMTIFSSKNWHPLIRAIMAIKSIRNSTRK